ncbi:MAG: hypothetical protein KJZ68_00650, partial [Phycisphaerales bacterium]|nr:hypothetical protein [Phycisphaerales bacterium]
MADQTNDYSNPDDPSSGTPGGSGGGGFIGHVVDREIERELHDSYLTYAMSTIMDRALPDVRDGLKPSQRRILVAMNDLNLGPGRKHIKCAKICGDTSGNYHPHGEGVIYPTRVNMAQEWKMRHPLIDPQGNFGSIGGDPPAHMRYTEARMTAAAVELLQDLNLDTVDFQLRRAAAGAAGASRAIPQPAGQRVQRHRGGHGLVHPAAQSGGDLRRHRGGDRQARHLPARPAVDRARAGLPD